MSTATFPVQASSLLGRSLRHALRNLDALLIGVMLPVMLLLLFTTVFGGALDVGGGAYIDYVVPGVILLCTGYGAANTAVAVTQDVSRGIVDRFRTIGVAGAAVLSGHVVASLLRNVVSTALVIGTALAIGFRPSAGPLEWLAVIGMLVLYIAALSWLAALVGLLVRSVDAAGAFSFFLLFLPYLSSAFVVIATLPGWLQPVAEHQPITPVTETLRGLLFGGADATTALVSVAWCAGIAAASILGCLLVWRRRARG